MATDYAHPMSHLIFVPYILNIILEKLVILQSTASKHFTVFRVRTFEPWTIKIVRLLQRKMYGISFFKMIAVSRDYQIGVFESHK